MPELHEYDRGFSGRSLEVRLTEYRDSLLGIAEQFREVKALLNKRELDSSALDDPIELYQSIANDLTKVINGDELPLFTVLGEL